MALDAERGQMHRLLWPLLRIDGVGAHPETPLGDIHEYVLLRGRQSADANRIGSSLVVNRRPSPIFAHARTG